MPKTMPWIFEIPNHGNDYFGFVGDSTKLHTGDLSSTGYYYQGYIDEFAIYERVLSDDEVLRRYKRGILRLNLSVRSCDDSNCNGESWVDVDDISPVNLSVPDNRYFQYKYEFSTENYNYTPELSEVIVDYKLIDPTITQYSPNDNFKDTDGEVGFICKSSSVIGLKNITLYVWDTNS